MKTIPNNSESPGNPNPEPLDYSLFRTIWDTLSVAMALSDAEGTILYANEAYLELYNLTSDKLIVKKLSLTYPQTSRYETRQWYSHLFNSSSPPSPIEATFVREDGDERIVEASFKFLYEDRQPAKLLTMVRDITESRRAKIVLTQDITERKQAEKHLAQWKDIIQSAEEAIISFDFSGQIVTWNAGAQRLYGYTPHEAIGRNISLIVPPEMQNQLPSLMREIEEGKGALQYEAQRVTKDGTHVIVSISSSPLRDAEGNLVGQASIVRDITARKQAEEAFTKSQALFANIVNSAMDAIITIDSDQRITLFNNAAEKMFGWSAAEVLNQPLNILLPPRFRRIHSKHITEFGETGVTARTMGALGDLSGMRKDSTEFPVEASISQVEISDRKIYSVILRDITGRKEAEEALAQNEKRFRALVENSMDAIALLQADGTITYGSTSTTTVLGYAVNELLSLNAFDLIHIDDHKLATDWLVTSLSNPGAGIRYLLRAQHKNGSWRWIEGVFTNLLDEPAINAIVSNYRDVTERKQIEDQIYYQANLIQNVTDAVIATDVMFNIESWNKGAERMYGWRAEEVIGKPSADILKSEFTHLSRQEVINLLNVYDEFQDEARQVRKDGSTIYVQAAITFLRDSAGKHIGIVSVNRDITERKRNEQRQSFLAKASETLARSLDYTITLNEITHLAIPQIADWCGIVLMAEDGALQSVANMHVDPSKIERISELRSQYGVNDDYTLGFNQVLRTGEPHYLPEITDELLDDYALSPQDPMVMKFLRESNFRSLIAVPLIVRGRTIGTLTFAVNKNRPAYTSDDLALFQELARRAANTIDNANLYYTAQRLNEELEQRVKERTADLQIANKELEAFSYSVSHDLRAPVSHIVGFVGLLQNRLSSTLDEKENRYLNHISESATWMGTLIDDLLSFSRVGRTDLRKIEFNMDDIVHDVISEYVQDTQSRQITWHVDPLARVRADHSMIRLVWTNLIANAVKYTRNQPEADIKIGCYRSGKEGVFFISDNGVGFDMKYVDKLFGVFQRLHSTAQFEGTGIGLANVQRIIHRHGGRTWARGEINAGASFYFTLPTQDVLEIKEAQK